MITPLNHCMMCGEYGPESPLPRDRGDPDWACAMAGRAKLPKTDQRCSDRARFTCNAILAGVTDTPALRLISGHEKLMEFARQRNPHRRLTVPEDVARCVAALCHPATYWLTGNSIHVDGGEDIVG